MDRARTLRGLLAGQEIVIAPGVYDGLTARMVELAGYSAAYMTGAGTSLSRGYPDLGLLTLTEMAGNAAVITRTIELPLIADADTGYGNELNVTRTVQEYERAGVAAMHLEDQVSPKRCGHLAGKEIVPRDEFVAKIRAAAAARRNSDFVLIARTDARAVSGLEEALWRVNAALAAGADVGFVEAIPDMSELADVPRLVNGPCLLNVVQGGRTPEINLLDAQAMGYRLAIMPSLLLSTMMETAETVLASLQATHQPPSGQGKLLVADRFRRFRSDEWDALRNRFRSVEPVEAADRLVKPRPG